MQIQTNQGHTVEFTPGTMTKFTANETFTLPPGPGGVAPSIQRGMEVEFDGRSLAYGGFPATPVPQFLGAVKAGWVTPSEHFDTSAAPNRPVSANISVRPADTGNPNDRHQRTAITTAQAEERHVRDVGQHAAEVRQGNEANYRRPAAAPGARVITADDQEGIAVRTLKTPADRRKSPDGMNDVTDQTLGQALREANSVKIEPGKGRSREEMMAQMTEEQRAQYLAEIEGRRAMYAGPEAQGAVVAQIRPQQTGPKTSEGITAEVYVGGGTETVDVGGTGEAAEVTTRIVEGVKFTETNGPKKDRPKPVQSQDPRRVIAKSICSDFPDNYDFDSSLRKKIARLQADYEDRFDVIKAVAAAETDAEVKQRLVEEFPEAFQ